jgi:hypothetical protein
MGEILPRLPTGDPLMKLSPAHILLAVAAFVGFACAARQQPTATVPEDPALRAFVLAAEREWPGESLQQAMTAEALGLLANAVISVAERKKVAMPELPRDIQELRRQTTAYANGPPDSAGQTERLRQAFTSAADIIDELVEAAGLEKRPIDPRLSALRRAAESLDPASTPRRQQDVIERFFHHATEALQRVERS